MKYCLITFRSVTPAQRGDRLLRQAGFHCNLQRTPKWMEQQGCGYSLRVPQRDAAGCVHLLRSENVAFRKVYLLRESGLTEELAL